MITIEKLKNAAITDYLTKYSFLEGFLHENKYIVKDKSMTFDKFVDSFSNEDLEDIGVNKNEILVKINDYLNQMIT